MEKKKFFFVVVLVLTLSATAVPALSQSWEDSDKFGGQVHFERRDEKGILYFQIRNPVRAYAANCAKRAMYTRKGGSPQLELLGIVSDNKIEDIPTDSAFGEAFAYICKKYGVAKK